MKASQTTRLERADDDELITPADVRAMLRLESETAIYELCRARARAPLPHFRVGKYLRFKRGEVRAWLEANRA